MGIVGNTLSIAVFHETKSRRNTTNYLLGNIAVADLVTVVSLIPFTSLRLLQHPKGAAGRIVCILITKNNVASVSLNVSIFTLGLLAIERYNALIRPMRPGLRLTATSIWYAIVFSWASAVLFTLPLLIHTKLDDQTGRCQFTFHSQAYWMVAGILLLAAVVTICFCYFRIIRGFSSGEIIGASRSCDRSNADNYRDKRKVVTMLITVTVVFALCYIPRLAFFLLASHLKKAVNLYLFRRVSFLLLVSNSCINPMIYTLQSANFRSSLRRFLSGCDRKPQILSVVNVMSRASKIAPIEGTLA